MKICLLIFMLTASVAMSDEIKLIHQVMFEVNKEAITTLDFRNYLKSKKELKFQFLLPLVQNELEEFILFHLCHLELQNIEFSLSEFEKIKIKNPLNKKIIEVQNYLKLKERHYGQLIRYKSWTDILKRKYHFLPKMAELKNETRQKN